jgi:hypothetical protein
MRGDMSKASGPERVVPEGLYEGSDSTELVEVQARSAWNRVIRAIPFRRERCDRVGTSGYSMLRERSRTIDKIDQTVPTGRVLFLLSSRHFVPGLRRAQSSRYLRTVPTGRKPCPTLRAFSSHYSTTPVLRHSNIQSLSTTACPTKPKLCIVDRSSRPRKRGALHNHGVGEVGRTRTNPQHNPTSL